MRSTVSTAWGRMLSATSLVLTLGLLAALPASATTYTWSNSAGGNWSTSANWSPAGVPGTGDAVSLPSLGADYTVTLDASHSIASLTVGAGATLQMGTDDSLSYTGIALQNDGRIVVGPGSKNTFYVANTSDTLHISGSGTIELQGQGRIFASQSRPTLHYWVVNGAGHTITGSGSIFTPLINRGSLTQAGSGSGMLTLVQYLTNAGTVRVSDGGTINVRYGVRSSGGTIVGHNGTFMCRPTDQADLYNYGTIDGLVGGARYVADGGNLDLVVGVTTNANVYQTGGSGLVAFHTSSNPNNVVVTAGAEAMFDGGTNFHIDTNSIENHGIIHVQGTMTLGGSLSDTVATSSDGTLLLEGGTILGGQNMAGEGQWLLNNGLITGCGTIAGNFINAGTIDIDCPTLEASIAPKTFINRGRITISRGYLHAVGGTGTIRNIGVVDGANGGIILDGGATIQNTGGVLLAGRGSVTLGGHATTATIVGGTLGSSNGGYFVNRGQVTLQDATLAAGSTFYTAIRGVTTATGASLVSRGTLAIQQGGTFTAGTSTSLIQREGAVLLQGGTLSIASGVRIQGTLQGTGTVLGKLTNAGEVIPDVAGISVQGDYVQEKAGRLSMGVGGYTPDLFSHLAVSGNAALDGKVSLLATGGFMPQAGHTFSVMSFGSSTGRFAVTDASPGLQIDALYDAAAVSLQTSAPAGVGGPSVPTALAFTARGMSFALDLTEQAEVAVRAYDVTGRQVAVLASGVLPAGSHVFAMHTRGLSSGVYFARATLKLGARTEVRQSRLIVLK